MITKIIKDATQGNPKYQGTSVEAWSKARPATSGITIGEAVAKYLLTEKGYTIGDRTSTEHDTLVNGKMVEIKTAFENKEEEYYTFYGYSPTDDPHYWIYQFVTPDEEVVLIKMDRVAMSHVRLYESKGAFMFRTTIEEMIESGGKEIMRAYADVEPKGNGNYECNGGTLFATRNEIGQSVAWNWVKDNIFGGGFNTFREAYKNLKG